MNMICKFGEALGRCLLGAANTGIGRPEDGLAQISDGLDLYHGLKTPPVAERARRICSRRSRASRKCGAHRWGVPSGYCGARVGTMRTLRLSAVAAVCAVGTVICFVAGAVAMGSSGVGC
jgi:hypothetical protein